MHIARRVLLLVTVSVVTLGIFGCQSQKADKVKEVKLEKTEAEKEKASLLKKVNRRFEDADAHYRLGELYQRDGLWTKAEYEYTTALSFDPVHRQSQAALVKVLQNLGDAPKSKVYADIYIGQAASTASGSLSLALAFQKQGLDEYAFTCYQQCLRLAPNSAKVNRQIGYYYLSKGDKVRAQEYLSRSFQLDPRQADVAGELGRLGIAVQIPKKKKNPKSLDQMIDEADKELQR